MTRGVRQSEREQGNQNVARQSEREQGNQNVARQSEREQGNQNVRGVFNQTVHGNRKRKACSVRMCATKTKTNRAA
ncbi:hypothetical protein FACS1894133_1130 [Clostridia bacterium]|nr:hypothetical protein FACS1894133_1130 [Clostridia bacterium]